ncbi:MAG TPA: tyrosine-type recombinase/integrase [Dehalococcoidia bacterium]|nr:tyrosine-type recombinase/integrase [Dehalococcoidia bacterium]
MMEVERFISTLTHKGSLNPAADNTKTAYRYDLERFGVFLDGGEATGEMAQQFLRQELDRGLKLSSVARYGRAIRKYLVWEGKSDDASSVLLPTPGRKLPEYHKMDTINKLIELARTPLERAVVVVLSDTGFRISELLALTADDIDWKNGLIFADRTKTNMQGWIPISQKGMDALRAYIKWAKPKGKLFPYTYHQIRNWIKELGEIAGVKVRLHMFRHSNAVISLERGEDISIIKQRLGHKNINTTMIYLQLMPQDLKKGTKGIW